MTEQQFHAVDPDTGEHHSIFGTRESFEAYLADLELEEVDKPPAAQVQAAQVKAEAHRRILAIMPEWKQRNLTAQAAQLAEKGRANWTPEEQAAWDAGKEQWDQILLIRQASDMIEADTPISADFATDPRWPA